MKVEREDRSTFAPDEVKRLLWGMQSALSFARGHWVYPAAPVGFDQDDRPVWTEWGPGMAEPSRDGLGWWDDHRPDDLWTFLDRYLTQWLDPDRHKITQLATTYAVSAVETGFVEQRLLTATTALEMISWVIEVQERGVAEADWRSKRRADQRLRKLLADGQISLKIDASKCPALAQFGQSLTSYDGPSVITEIRHRLTHPKDNRDLYAIDKLLAEAHLLSLRYLEMVLLHRLRYVGNIADRTHQGRWAGTSTPAPWE
jgi:hypothetical protein